MQCTKCSQDNPPGTRFCGYCGSRLRAGATDTAELRQLTVLFCDLVGSTALSETLDPEDLRELTGAYQAVCAAAIKRHDGNIAQYLGDGVLVYFGYPAAHEDDARRAVRAALEIVDDLATVAMHLGGEQGIRLGVRIGIHTGPVVVGEVGAGERREQLAVGMTPNLAARIQSIAAPGTVLVSEDTYGIVRGFFDFKSLGSHDIKGLAKAVTLHHVLRESGAKSRLDSERRTGLTPFTGRSEEFAQLDRRWHSLPRTGGHAVVVQGEAGIGKSRIVDSFREHVKSQATLVLECFCTPYAQSTPLSPIIGMLEHTFGFTREHPAEQKRAAIEQRLQSRGILTSETSALITQLLDIPSANGNPLAGYSPQKRRDRTLETLLDWLMAAARDGPTLWIVEDLHWADPTTLEFLTSLIGPMAQRPLLAILTSRPEFSPPWKLNGSVSAISLSRLSPDHTKSMAVRVARGKAIPDDVLSQIVARTEGIPLFVEEVTKAVLELGVLIEREDRFETSGPLPHGLIPSTVQGSLNARLDRLGPAKATAQLAATIGREFRFALLSAVADSDDSELRSGLNRLMDAELLFRLDSAPEETYLFKHALVRDAAYQSLLRKSRRQLHERIAETLTDKFPETAKQQPELVAEHFTAADRADQAVKLWLLAGQQAVSRAANHEAIIHANRGLALVDGLPEAERNHAEFQFLMVLMPALIAAESWASPGLERVYQRAEALLSEVDDTPTRYFVNAGIISYHFIAGRVHQSLGQSEKFYTEVAAIGDPLLLTVGHQLYTCNLRSHGDFRLAAKLIESGVGMMDLERERLFAPMLQVSSCVCMLFYEASVLWMLGYPERGTRSSQRCLEVARAINHAPSIALALSTEAVNRYLLGDPQGALKFSDETLTLAREERLGFWEPYVAVYRGWALSELADPAEAAAGIRSAIERYRAAGNGIQLIIPYAILAGSQWKAGACDDAFQTLADGMQLAKDTNEGLFEPELYRLKGEFLLSLATGAAVPSKTVPVQDPLSLLNEAEQNIRQSLQQARHQEARMLELRSLVTLCRVQRAKGSVCDRAALADAYAAFTEGFETPDLQAARAMLETL